MGELGLDGSLLPWLWADLVDGTGTLFRGERLYDIKATMSESIMTLDARPGSPVTVVGAGPTGLTLAASLLLKDINVVLIDRQAEGANTSRAAGVNARTLEVLDGSTGLDVTRRLVKEGIEAPRPHGGQEADR